MCAAGWALKALVLPGGGDNRGKRGIGMRQIVIGMDGAQAETLLRGWTPCLASIVGHGESLPLKEDLISRGWAEIVLGKYATVTGAMYDRPVLDGSYNWTDKFNLNQIPGLGRDVRPFWQVLNERGYKTGIMNVPTTYPAPHVDGFFVSGGGGGGGVSQDVAAEQCYPSHIRSFLHDTGYILDERLESLLFVKGLYEPDLFFERLDEMNQKRTAAFMELARKQDIDLGFIVYRSTMTAETLVLPELDREKTGKTNINNSFLDAVKKFYRKLDEYIHKLVEAFPEAEVILVSDHGTVPRRWSVNLNAFLHETGYQKISLSRRKSYQFVTYFRHWIPVSVRKRLKGNPRIKTAYHSMTTFDPLHSLAFNNTRRNAIHGIYINDKRRFGGPVSESDMEALEEQILQDFNCHPDVLKHGLSARKPFKPEGKYSVYYPDIIVDMPEGYAPSNDEAAFIKRYSFPDRPIDLYALKGDEKWCVKGHYPLAVSKDKTWRAYPTSEKNDLRVVYDHVLASFPGHKNG